MANLTKNYETTGGTIDGGGAKPYDFTKLEGWTGGINPNGMYTNNVTSKTKVLCKDGNFDYESSSPNAKYDNSKTCRNNGGRAENQPVADAPKEVAYQPVIKQDAEDKFYEKLGIETQGNRVMSGGGISSKSKGRLLVAVVLVAGYFAYKKFKK